MAARQIVRKHRVKASAGNVYKDLGFRNAETELAKAQLAHRIVTVIEERELTQLQAARLLGIDQPGVSHLMRGNLKRFSMDRLFRLLNALGRDVEIVVKPKSRSRAHGSVTVAPARRRPRKSA
jgi:predicted XRE-type DNA-binding protein